jgi:hypothetical protein
MKSLKLRKSISNLFVIIFLSLCYWLKPIIAVVGIIHFRYNLDIFDMFGIIFMDLGIGLLSLFALYLVITIVCILSLVNSLVTKGFRILNIVLLIICSFLSSYTYIRIFNGDYSMMLYYLIFVAVSFILVISIFAKKMSNDYKGVKESDMVEQNVNYGTYSNTSDLMDPNQPNKI